MPPDHLQVSPRPTRNDGWPRSGDARLPVLVIALIAVSVGWLAMWPYWPFHDRLVDLGKIVAYSWWAFGAWTLGLGIWVTSLAMLVPALRGARWSSAPVPLTLITCVLFSAFLIMYPVSAIDVFIYAARSHLFTTYGENPNAVQPVIHWETDPFVHFASKEWSDNLSPYGPLWNLIAAPVTWAGGTSIGAAILGFKALACIAVAAIGLAIYRHVGSISPEWAVAATLFWLWNPFVLWDGIANAHNDVVMMVPIIVAAWCWQRRRFGWVIPLLAVSIAIKYIAIILLPLALVALMRANRSWVARRTILVQGVLGSTAVGVIALVPFFDPGSLWKSFNEQGARFSATPAWAAATTWTNLTGRAADLDLVRYLAYAITAGIVAGLCVWVWRDPSRLIASWFEALFAFCLIASTNQRPWYTLWLVPLAAMCVPGYRWIRAGTWSISSMLGYIGQIYLWYVWDFDRYGAIAYRMILVGVMFGPVLAATIVEWVLTSRRWRPRQAEDPPGAIASPVYTSPR